MGADEVRMSDEEETAWRAEIRQVDDDWEDSSDGGEVEDGGAEAVTETLQLHLAELIREQLIDHFDFRGFEEETEEKIVVGEFQRTVALEVPLKKSVFF